MRRAVALLLLAAAAAPQEESIVDRFLAQEREAFAHFEKQDWERAAAAFERQIAIFKENPRPYYNIACCRALQGDAERAATWLRLAVAHGWRDADWLQRDTDFQGIRGSKAYEECLKLVREARRLDPPAMPRPVPVAAVAGAPSAREILDRSRAEEALVLRLDALYDEHQTRKRLFAICDQRLARLARYVLENGDARDAHEAGHERVRTALLYRSRAGEGDEELRRIASFYVAATAQEFEERWPGSPLLPDVRYWRAFVLASLEPHRTEAKTTLRALLADHPGFRFEAEARAELCGLLARDGPPEELAREFALVEPFAQTDRALRARLTEARLKVKGLPPVDPAGTLAAALAGWTGPVCYAFVVTGDEACESTLRGLRGRTDLKTVVCVLDPAASTPDEDLQAWLGVHAEGLLRAPRGPDYVELFWLTGAPTLVLVRDGVVASVGPELP